MVAYLSYRRHPAIPSEIFIGYQGPEIQGYTYLSGQQDGMCIVYDTRNYFRLITADCNTTLGKAACDSRKIL